MAIRVKFSDVDEFLAELACDRSSVDRNIVRVAKRWRHDRTIPIQHVQVLAGFLMNGQAVALEKYVGEYYCHGGEKVKEQADEIVAKIEAAVQDLGLECRAGVFEEEPKP